MNNAGNYPRQCWYGRNLSAWACHFSILWLFRGPEFRELSDPQTPKICALWTWTFPNGECAFNIKNAAAAWRDMTKSGNFFSEQRRFVRVFELAPRTERCHIHAVTDEFWRVQEVRETAQKFGFGRIDVQPIPVERAPYIAKYLNKRKPEGIRGVRWWAAAGFRPTTARMLKYTVTETEYPKDSGPYNPPEGYLPGRPLTDFVAGVAFTPPPALTTQKEDNSDAF